jgi:large subunit ribosomal protein L15
MASKAARCRCTCACPSAASATSSAPTFAELNLGRLQKAIDDKKLDISQKVTGELLRKAGVVHKSEHGVRLLGKGELSAKLDLEVAGASAGARAAVEKAGGTLTLTYKKASHMNKKGVPGKRKQRSIDAAEKRAARKAAAGATAG